MSRELVTGNVHVVGEKTTGNVGGVLVTRFPDFYPVFPISPDVHANLRLYVGRALTDGERGTAHYMAAVSGVSIVETRAPDGWFVEQQPKGQTQ